MSTLEHYNIKASGFRNKGILIIGPTNSGKTTLISDVLKKLDDDNTKFYLYAPDDHDLTKCIPRLMCFTGEQLTAESINNIYEQCEHMSKIKQCVADKYKDVIKMVNKTDEHLGTKLHKAINKLRKKSKDEKTLAKCIFYTIRDMMADFEEPENLSDKEKKLLKACQLRADKTVVIIDDLTEVLTERFGKKNSEGEAIFTKVITKCRHHDLTLIIGCHSSTGTAPIVRQNSRIIFWCKSGEVDACKSGTTKGYPKELIKKIDNVETYFADYRKMFYYRDTETLGTYKAKLVTLTKLGCRALHRYSEAHTKEEAVDLDDLI